MINPGAKFKSISTRVLCGAIELFLISSAHAQAPSKQGVSVDLLITGGTIVTMDPSRRILEDGFIAVRGDELVAVGSGASASLRFAPKGVDAKLKIDARGKLILPGFINGHTHVPMTLLRGLRDDVTLEEWLTKFIFPAEAKNVTEEFVRWGTRLAAAEQIRGGVTTFADMYYFEDAIAEETKAAEMRGVLGETILDFPAPDNTSNAAMLEYSAPILIHVAEMKKELDDSRAQNGTTPVQYLDKLGILGPDTVAAHCIYVDETDRKILAERQVGCVHNPSSNMMLASGVAPVIEERAAGVAVGLGTDGPAGSNNDLDLMEEMDLAAKLQKITKMDPQALGAKAVVEMSTIEGARALHMEKEIGSLAAGKKADLSLIGLDAPNAVPYSLSLHDALP